MSWISTRRTIIWRQIKKLQWSSKIKSNFWQDTCSKSYTWWVNLLSGLPNRRANPKSASLSCPLGPINKLFGFISLSGRNSKNLRKLNTSWNKVKARTYKHIPMQDIFLVTKSKSFQRHLDIRFYIRRWEEDISITNHSLKICLHELKHKMQVSFVREGINQFNNVRILQLFQ